jgi:HD-GYP domain-containing protein (c-di-GMP phosphodiesterase class II)
MEQADLVLDEELELTDHGRSVAVLAMRLARALGFDRAAQREIGLAGALHDIGKRDLDPAILEKTGSLDPSDWVQIRLHPALGEQILRRAGLDSIARWVRWHHERPDGRGYPDQLRSPDIPLEASILAVADAFDAMITARCYGRRLHPVEARGELRRYSGYQFDPVVVAAALRCGLDVSDGTDARAAIDWR